MKKAKKNEKRFKNEITPFGIILNDAQTYEDNNIKTSVDFKMLAGDKEVLIEIDSYNMSKVVVGQYVILNTILQKQNISKNKIFIIIHFYKGFNTERTKKHMDFINQYSLANKGIPYKAYTYVEFKEICRKEKNNQKLIEKLFQEAIKK